MFASVKHGFVDIVTWQEYHGSRILHDGHSWGVRVHDDVVLVDLLLLLLQLSVELIVVAVCCLNCVDGRNVVVVHRDRWRRRCHGYSSRQVGSTTGYKRFHLCGVDLVAL